MLSGAFPSSMIPSSWSRVALFFDAAIALNYVDSTGRYSCSLGSTYCHSYSSKAYALSNNGGCIGSNMYFHNNVIIIDEVNIQSSGF